MTTNRRITGKQVEVVDIRYINEKHWDTVDLCDHVSVEGVATNGNEYFHSNPEYIKIILIRCKACNLVHEIKILVN